MGIEETLNPQVQQNDTSLPSLRLPNGFPITPSMIATSIAELGFMVGKNDCYVVPSNCKSLEIYKVLPKKVFFGLFGVKEKPVYVGKLTIADEKGILPEWRFDNEYFGKPIEHLITALSQEYHVPISYNTADYLTWEKDDVGI
ncbi:MAG: hypothetical protein QW594_01150 [Candidatus Woesearchaeota archaeon]